MNKKIIYAVVIIILVIIIILAFFIFSDKNKIVNLHGVKNPALSLCNDMNSGCKANSVVPCNYKNSTIYRVDYDCTDIPAKYFDSNLNLLADYCWGMPAANQTKLPQLCYDLDEKCQYDNNMCK